MTSHQVRNKALIRLKYTDIKDSAGCEMREMNTNKLLSKSAEYPNRYQGNKHKYMYVSRGYKPMLHTCRRENKR